MHWRRSSASSPTTWRETTPATESAYPEKSSRRLPKSGNHTRHTPTGLALATPSPMRSADTRNRLATEVAPDTPDTHPRFRSLPPTPSDSGGILPSSPHTTYWGYLSQADTHLTVIRPRSPPGPMRMMGRTDWHR